MAPRTVRSSSLKMSFEDELGVLPPVGFWDPLGLSSDGDEVVFKRRREVELKHGRVSMLAVLGYLVAEIARFPGSIDLDGTSFQSIPNGVGAITVIPAFGWFQIAASVGYWEIFGWQKASDTAGDFGTGYFGKSLEGEEKVGTLTITLMYICMCVWVPICLCGLIIVLLPCMF
jgi:hypothetical protein